MKEKFLTYTKSNLFEDIQEEPKECEKDSYEREKACREYKYKLKVFQTIFDLNLPDFDFVKENSEKIKKEIEVQVDNNELFYGYTFFLSLNPNFNYSWNYLRKQIERYMDFLYEAHKFISYVIYDINLMKSKLNIHKDLHIEFNELFDVKFNEVAPIKTTINWNNFNEISKVKNGYYVIAKYDETILLTSFRKYNEQPDLFIESINKILQGQKARTDKKDEI